MATLDDSLLSVTFRLAGPVLAPDLMARLREEVMALMAGREPLPDYLVDTAFATGDAELIWTLSGCPLTREREPVLLRLAALGYTALGPRLYRGYGDRRKLRATVLEGAKRNLDDPDWHEPDGLVEYLLNTSSVEELLPALRAPFPGVVRHALKCVGYKAGADDQLAACQAVLTYGGVAELAELAELPALRPTVADLVRRAVAAPDPAVVLAGASVSEATDETADKPAGPVPAPDAPALSGADLVNRLREVRWTHDAFPLGHVDWDPLLAEHRREPLPNRALLMLAARQDCPDEIVLAAYKKAPRDLPGSSPLPWQLLTDGDWNGSHSRFDLAKLLGRGIHSGAYPVTRVLAEIRPARTVLNALPYGEAPVREALTGLAAELGEDFAAWRALYSLMPRFAGTSTELVTAAREQTAKHRGKTWPRPLAPEYPVSAPEGARAVFLQLYGLAAEDVQLALAEHLDRRSIQHLLVHHKPSAALRDRFVELYGVSVLAGIASDWELPENTIAELLLHDDPEINAKLYINTPLTPEQRRQILSGQRSRPDSGEGPLPLTEEVFAGLRDSGRRHWLLPICEAGDPRLARILLGKVKLHTLAGQLLLLVRLWERHGGEEVRALLDETEFPDRRSKKHPLPAATHKIVRSALEAPDGLAELRERLARAKSPTSQATHLRSAAEGRRDQLSAALERLAEETGPDLPWEELTAEHGRDPLPDALLVELAKRDDFPEELRADCRLAEVRLEHRAHPHRLTGPRPTALELLRHHQLPGYVYGHQEWLNLATSYGQLTLPDILHEAKPARVAATYLANRHQESRDSDKEQLRRVRRETVDLINAHLGKDPEAWAVAMRLMPEFTGTLPELLATTAAVIS
ncbi:hypothetical protein [Streptomyces sp. ME19-01-6]|uniref:hypothetical protein n=1 Tax=Streptomyces sp. ME19-01-6 TaxID=3028686 RepID=UPI0029A647EE|nr:hypothetical protein [Streptomyces sp. ME19-01-6]MDX3232166.1 hypothetical protein [Streptomyces sp. ME19-01-6]